MRVKEAVLTFVAMGGFAVPVAFQTSADSGATTASVDRTAAAAPLTVKPEAKKEA